MRMRHSLFKNKLLIIKILDNFIGVIWTSKILSLLYKSFSTVYIICVFMIVQLKMGIAKLLTQLICSEGFC